MLPQLIKIEKLNEVSIGGIDHSRIESIFCHYTPHGYEKTT